MVRLKTRYVLVKINFVDKKQYHPINVTEIIEAINTAVHDIHGDGGLSQVHVGLNVKYLNVKTKLAIIRVRRNHYQLLATSLPFISSINCERSKTSAASINCFFQTLHVAGTIRTLQKFIIKYNNLQLQILDNAQDAKSNQTNSAVDTYGTLESSADED